jgi:RNA polymerase sigma-70 factor (ECF subfamily)
VAELTACAQAGDEGALDLLCAEIRPYLVKLFSWQWEQQEDAEDLAQETLIRIVLKLRRGYKITSFKSWAWWRAHETLVDHYRALKGRGKEPKPIAVPLNDYQGKDGSFENRAIANVVMAEALSRVLTDEGRIAVVSCYFQGKTAREYAGEIAVPEKTVEGRLEQAKRKLRTALGAPLTAGDEAYYHLRSISSAKRPKRQVAITA